MSEPIDTSALVVGDELWWEPSERWPAAGAVKVIKVGRRWVHFSNGIRIEAEDGDFHDDDPPGSLYRSQDEYEAEVAWQALGLDLFNARQDRPADIMTDKILQARQLLGLSIAPPTSR